MDIIKEEGFRRLIKSGELSGGYIFFGDEDYLKSFSVRSAREAVCTDESFAIFNDMKIDALDYTPAALLEALMPFPMMGDKKIVTVNGLAISDMKPSEVDELCDVLATLAEYDYNVLIINVPAGKFDEGNLPKKPSPALTKLSKFLTPVRFDAIPPARLSGWVAKHFEHNGVRASAEVCTALIERCGTSMFTLASEVDKISYYALWNGRNSISQEDVKNVSCAQISADTFALANALLDGKSDRALEVLSVMKFRRIDPIIILAEVSKILCDLISVKSMLDMGSSNSEIAAMFFRNNEYRTRIYVSGAASKSMEKLRRAVELCSEADIALKLSPQGYSAIERLICSL